MQHILILARSGRALAKSARKAGYLPHVLDAYADSDTRAIAVSCNQCGFSDTGFDEARCLELVNTITSDYVIGGLVVGSGIERSTDIANLFATIPDCYCNSADTVRQLVDPVRFNALLDSLSIPHPDVFFTPPEADCVLLSKRPGGMGGEYVDWYSASTEQPAGAYLQEYITGKTRSVVFLADGNNAQIVGFNEQWQCKTSETTPFTYAGACSIHVEQHEYQYLATCLQQIVAATNLKGLCGLDYLVDADNRIYVIEVNPRPPATFELHEADEQPIFTEHLLAFESAVKPYRRCDPLRACVIIYAEHKITIKNERPDWPSWTQDRPQAGIRIEPGQPVCSVFAEAETVSELHLLVNNRAQAIRTQLLTGVLASPVDE